MTPRAPNQPDVSAVVGVRLSTAGGIAAPYAPPAPRAPIDLYLDANEGPAARIDVAGLTTRMGPSATQRYPDAAPLERLLAERLGIAASRVLVTAGGDEAIDRACRACLEPGRELILPTPTFEMIGRYARQTGAKVVTTPWPTGPYPIETVLGSITHRTAMIAVVSPNNPTGAVATSRGLERIAAAAPQALILVDLAYAEFAEEDLTRVALGLPNAVVIRTFSKAFGLAGLRVGYAIGPEPVIRSMRSVGGPYPVSALSLLAATEALGRADDDLPKAVAMVRGEREQLHRLLVQLGARPLPSQANFILANFDDAEWVWRALAGVGIGVRRFGAGSGLDQMLRITLPGDAAAFARLNHGLRAALRPGAILFDMDGVLADVSGSYRRAIVLAAASFGVAITLGEVAAAKTAGDANNDWVLTHRLVSARGGSATLQDVTTRFEAIYQGEDGRPGLEATERPIPSRPVLERLAARVPLGIVTGRPRRDCKRFLDRFGLSDFFRVAVCMEDGPAKPDPEVVRLALQRLGIADAWLVGDTPDDVAAARAARVVPIGFVAPGDDTVEATQALVCAGAAATIASLEELERMLP